MFRVSTAATVWAAPCFEFLALRVLLMDGLFLRPRVNSVCPSILALGPPGAFSFRRKRE